MDPNTRLECLPISVREVGECAILVEPETPNWAVIHRSGVPIVGLVDGRRTFGRIVAEHAAGQGLPVEKAWIDCDALLGDLLRRGIVNETRPFPSPYAGRGEHLQARGLRELWLHPNNNCNLTCEHCLVSSGPKEDRGLSSEELAGAIDQAFEMGAERFFQTGGEPFLRPDILETIERVTSRAEMAILTNGTVLPLEALARLPEDRKARLILQLSIDGPDPESNDPIRGKGSFLRIEAGARGAREAGLANLTLSAVVTRSNADRIPEMAELAARWGIPRLHLMWLHRRGRAASGGDGSVPAERLSSVYRATLAACRERGVLLDNHEALKFRLERAPGTRHDLSGAGYESLCVSFDGSVYPSAALSGVRALRCGDLRAGRTLAEIWRDSPVLAELRRATVARKAGCSSCRLKFLCGGGDVEHSWFHSLALGSVPSFLGPDPYSELHQATIEDAMLDLAGALPGGRLPPRRHGFASPHVLASMGGGGSTCATGEEPPLPGETIVRTTSSNCVLSVEVDAARAKVREFYARAAEKPEAKLCCPTSYPASETDHIPREVIERFYGCGSPIAAASPAPGEKVVDLGSGAGIDCFLAAKQVGRDGRVVGVDMTDAMLEVARRAGREVASRLGYDAVLFRKGYLEEVPVEDSWADLVTSNCVLNLSPDKARVFAEIRRILADHGRFVVSDVVCDRSVPAALRCDPRLWGECIGGALSKEEFLAALERAGFHGVEVLREFAWREVMGYNFSSVTVRGYKFEKKEGCVFAGQWAVYHGPYKAVLDEEGHLFPREEPVEVCSDTAARLVRAPYAGSFSVFRPGMSAAWQADGCGCSPSGCCS